MDIRLALMSGTDIPAPECKLILHQPKIKEIAFIGEDEFFKGVQTLCINKSMFTQGKDGLDNINNFQIFMTVMNEKETLDKRDAVKQVLNLLLPNGSIMFTPQTLLIQSNNINNIIDEDNFDFLQDYIKLIFCSNNTPMDQQAFNPGNSKAREIAEKLMRGRQRVAEQKGSSNSSIFSQYLSILAIGLHISPNELVELTMYQLFDLVERYMLYTNWDIDIRSRLAGAQPDSQPDNWMKNIHN